MTTIFSQKFLSLPLLASFFLPVFSQPAKAALVSYSITTPTGDTTTFTDGTYGPVGDDINTSIVYLDGDFDIDDSNDLYVRFGTPATGSYAVNATYNYDPSLPVPNHDPYPTNNLSGILPPNTMAVFSYNTTGPLETISGLFAEMIGTSIRTDYPTDYGRYHAWTQKAWGPNGSISGLEESWEAIFDHEGQRNIYPSLVLASAQIDSDTTGTLIIKNLSAGLARFDVFIGREFSAAGTGEINVAMEISAVPIPAALPMFGLGLTALAGIRCRRRSTATRSNP